MSLLDAFKQMDQQRPINSDFSTFHDYQYEAPAPSQQPTAPTTQPYTPPTYSYGDTCIRLNALGGLYSMGGYVPMYPTNAWDASSPVLDGLDDLSRLPAFENKLDPNKIFSSDINNFKKLSMDQQKIVRIFEKRLMEALTEKGKFGVTEEDIEALQALTAARAQITNIAKEQVNVKKSIVELKIKQAANANNGTSDKSGDGSGRQMSTSDIGRNMLDNIFQMSTPLNTPQPVPDNQYESISEDDVSALLVDSLPEQSVSKFITLEPMNPTTYVVVGETDSDVEFATYAANGELIPDYPNPTTKIDSIDRDAGKAVDDLLVSYPIKIKNDNQ